MKYNILLLPFLIIYGCNNRNSIISDDFKDVKQDYVVHIIGQLDSIDSNAIKINVPVFDYTEREIDGTIDMVFDTIVVVPLETQDNCIIGTVDQLEIVNDTIYVRDQYKTHNICVFNIEGKFIRTIGHQGPGPAEFIEPSDMHVTQDAVYVYDQWQHKLLKYNHNGECVFDNRLPFICQQIISLSGNNYIFRGINADNYHLPDILDYNMWLTDSTYTIRKVGIFCEHDKYHSIWENYHLIRDSDFYLYYDYTTDVVYNIDKTGTFIPLYKFCFEKNHSEELLLSSNKSYTKNSNSGEYISLTRFRFIGSSVVYTLFTNQRTTYVFNNLENNEVKYFKRCNLVESNLSRIISINKPICSYGGYMVYCLPSDVIISQYKYAKEQNDWWKGAPEWVKENDIRIFNTISEEGNDVVVFGRLNKNFY